MDQSEVEAKTYNYQAVPNAGKRVRRAANIRKQVKPRYDWVYFTVSLAKMIKLVYVSCNITK